MSSPSAGGLQAPPNPAFPYAHGFSHPGQYVHEAPMIPQNPHMAYSSPTMPALLQHHSSPGPSSMFGHAQITPSPPPRSPLSSSGSQAGPPHSAAYPGQASFYPPLSSSPFPYPAQSFPSSPPIYQSQYSPSYPSQFVSPSEQERHGTWWYVPSNVPSPSQYDPISHPFPAHYTVAYPSLSRQELEAYNRPGPSSVSSAGYPMSPVARPGPVGYPHSLSAGPASAPPSLAYPTSPDPASSEVGAASIRATSRSSLNPSSVRRSYHPNPPTHRSEWVMWVGNVPGDATVEELWRVFNHPGPITQSADSAQDSDTDGQLYGGVVSIYPIVRSNCAFVNFESEAHLHSAIARFNGQPLRVHDPKCPRLVCRVRAKEDDLRAGVGAQRGTGLHTRWVREKRERTLEGPSASGEASRDDQSGSERVVTPTSSAESPRDLAHRVASLSLSSDEESRFRRGTKKSSSGSYASTNSSFLARHFPKRYFILKSLSQFDLDLSVEKGMWATQRHNEAILDQAYRTSQDVYLIFGVNKSGEFYGYARMAGPIGGSGQRMSWASRTDSSPASQRGSRRSDTIPEEGSSPTQARQEPHFFPLSEQRLVDQSPMPVSPPHRQVVPGSQLEPAREFLSAPAEMHNPHHRFSVPSPAPKQSLDIPERVLPAAPSLLSADNFELKAEPMLAARSRGASGSSSREAQADGEGVKRIDKLKDEFPGSPLRTVAEEGSKEEEEAEEEKVGFLRKGDENWGAPFRVEWIKTTRLPFWRTRHLRNPWNHEREVKVSRDGTELEPGVGQALLDEWDRPEPPQSPMSFKHPGQGKRPTGEQKSISTNTAPTVSRKGDV